MRNMLRGVAVLSLVALAGCESDQEKLDRLRAESIAAAQEFEAVEQRMELFYDTVDYQATLDCPASWADDDVRAENLSPVCAEQLRLNDELNRANDRRILADRNIRKFLYLDEGQ